MHRAGATTAKGADLACFSRRMVNAVRSQARPRKSSLADSEPGMPQDVVGGGVVEIEIGKREIERYVMPSKVTVSPPIFSSTVRFSAPSKSFRSN